MPVYFKLCLSFRYKQYIQVMKTNFRMYLPIAVTERSEARTVLARSNIAIVGSNPT
jgi:hypothetical protein